MDTSSRWRALGMAVALAGLAGWVGRAAAMSGPAAPPIGECMAAMASRLDFSGIVSVVRSGVPTTYARGRVAGPGSAPITPATRFNLGSAGKMFTAVAVAQLIDAGKIRLDDPIGRYVEGLTAEASAVTIRQLLDHSSGLGNYFAPENLPALIKARSLRDLLPLVVGEKPRFAPGSRFAYSDTGFLLLGLMVERVSGQGYGDYLRVHVFAPARMTASGLAPASLPAGAIGMTAMPAPPEGGAAPMMGTGPAHAQSPGDSPPLLAGPGLAPTPGPLRPAREAALQGGSAGGAFSTAGDMQNFFAALIGGKLTSAASFQLLVSPQIVAAPADGARPERDYGFGFGVGRFEHRRWFGHNGGAPGVNVEATAFPDDRVSLVVLANRDPPAATLLFQQIRAAVFEPAAKQGCGLRP